MATIDGLKSKIADAGKRRESVEAELAALEDQCRLYRKEFGPYVELAGALAAQAKEGGTVMWNNAMVSRIDKREAKKHKAEDDKLLAAIKDKRGQRQKLLDQESALAGQLADLDNKRLLARADTVEQEIADLQGEQHTLREAVNGATADLAKVEGQLDKLFAQAERGGNGAAQKAAEDAELKVFNLQMQVKRKKAALRSVDADLAAALDDKRRIDAIKAAERQAAARAAWQEAQAGIVALLESGSEITASKWAELKQRFSAVEFMRGQERPAQPQELYLEYAQRQYQKLGGSPAEWAAYGWIAGTSKVVR